MAQWPYQSIMEHSLYAQPAFADVLRKVLCGSQGGNQVTFQPSDLAGSRLVCGKVKHSMTPVHGDKLFVIQPSLARSLWAWTKISKDQSSHSSALSPAKSREM